jgi:indolepyruvate ferredoxin oxidoreductase
LVKIKFGGWLFSVFKLLCKLKFLRGTKFDPFGYLNERKKERELIRDYKDTITDIGTKINKSNYETAVKIASIPDQIRGFGHVKEKNIKEAINYRTDLLNSFHENT